MSASSGIEGEGGDEVRLPAAVKVKLWREGGRPANVEDIYGILRSYRSASESQAKPGAIDIELVLFVEGAAAAG